MRQFTFSERFNEIGLGDEENVLSRIKNQKEAAGISILNLINSNPTALGLEFPDHIIPHSMAETAVQKYDPSPKGDESARRAISEYYNTKGILVHPDDLILTSSTSESYSYLFKLLTNPGDEILIPKPGYPLFSFLTQFENLNALEYDLEETEDGQWIYSIEKIRNLITSKTKAVVLVSPANPTGSYLNESDWQVWTEWSEQSQIPLLVDEVFSPYFLFKESDYIYPTADNAPIFVLNGISKLLALPHMKLGWIHILGSEKFKKQAIAGLELLADTYLTVNTPTQKLLPELLKWSSMIQNQIKNRIRRNCSEAIGIFSGNEKIVWYNGQAGWYGWLEFKSNNERNTEEIAEQLLIHKNIYVHPGEWYGFNPNRKILVLSLILPEGQFLGGIKELTSFLK